MKLLSYFKQHENCLNVKLAMTDSNCQLSLCSLGQKYKRQPTYRSCFLLTLPTIKWHFLLLNVKSLILIFCFSLYLFSVYYGRVPCKCAPFICIRSSQHNNVYSFIHKSYRFDTHTHTNKYAENFIMMCWISHSPQHTHQYHFLSWIYVKISSIVIPENVVNPINV